MEKNVKFIDFNILSHMDGAKQVELENKIVRIEFDDCYFDIQVDPDRASSIKIQKCHKLYPNTDQILVEPKASNSINIH